MRVDLVDPPAYSPPYDHALAAALAREGVGVQLVTSAFAYGDAAAPDGYARSELFYRHAFGAAGSRLRALSKRAEHPLDMLRYQRSAAADVVHFQWLTVPRLDLRLLPRRPTVLTIHDPLERNRKPLPASAFARVDAIVVHSDYAREQVIAQHGLEPSRVHVIRHGALGAREDPGVPGAREDPGVPGAREDPGEPGAREDPGVPGAREAFSTPTVQNASRMPSELRDDGSPVVLSYGLIRPYKGIETLVAAWHGIRGAQLWIVGRPMMELPSLVAAAGPTVQLVPRFVTAAEEAALFARADLVVLPYERGERFGFSGVLATALGHGKAIVLSDVGGFAEVGRAGAARIVPAGDAQALHGALEQLLADPEERARLSTAALRAASTEFSWEAAARATLALYDRIATQ